MSRTLRVLLVVMSSLAAAACSPEAERTRGGDAGADTGNRPPEVKIHEGSDQYWQTPVRADVEHPPLDAARHAREVEQR